MPARCRADFPCGNDHSLSENDAVNNIARWEVKLEKRGKLLENIFLLFHGPFSFVVEGE